MIERATPLNETSALVHPPASIVETAHVKDYASQYKRSIEDPEGFWAARAKELEWFKPWTRVLDDSQAPFYKWFVGGRTNIVHNALDRHLKTYRKNKLALIWEGEPGDKRTWPATRRASTRTATSGSLAASTT
jgi:acetyl-CoA synthetase